MKATHQEIDDMILRAIKVNRDEACTIATYVGSCLCASGTWWPLTNKRDCPDRVIDRRLQSLRKRGVIRFSRVERRWVLA